MRPNISVSLGYRHIAYHIRGEIFDLGPVLDGSPSNTMSPGPRPTSILGLSGIVIHLAAIDMGRKVGGAAVPLSGGELGHHLTQCAMGLGFLRTKWHLDPSSRLATIDMGQIVGGLGCCDLLGGGAGSPSNTMWPGPRPTSIPSGILIHPAVWPQQTWAENWERKRKGRVFI